MAERILVTGATGYIGGRLVPRLLEAGYEVRCLARDPSRLKDFPWRDQVDVWQGDALDQSSLVDAMRGMNAAYYLIHGMQGVRPDVQRDLRAATNFASAAEEVGLERIIYLGNLTSPSRKSIPYLESRYETGRILRQGKVPVTEFRASLIIGSGSILFEMIRYLTEQMPVMVGPKWLDNRVQPIAVENVADYLLSALVIESCRGKIYEIGGKDVLTYFETITEYARLRGLTRPIIKLPFLTAKWMAYFASKLTPVPPDITLPLIDGMRSDSLVQDDSARRDFPDIRLIDYQTSVQNALSNLSPVYLESMWKRGEDSFGTMQEGIFVEARKLVFLADPELVYRTLSCLGGKNGWVFLNWLWKIRGFIDKLLGGPGLRGRNSTGMLSERDTLDFYRVEALRPGKMLRLRAELRSPGIGWMEWRIHPKLEGAVELSQIAYFVPHGLPGFLYWNFLLPFHRWMFAGLIKAIARKAMGLTNDVDSLQDCA